MIAKEDIRELKKIEYLRAYCEKTLAPGKQVGNSMCFRCPWGEHEKLHLDVHEYQGRGNAHCWACNRRGNIYDVASATLKKDVKKEFPEIVREVAEVVGYKLHEGGAVLRKKRGSTSWAESNLWRYKTKQEEGAIDEEIQFLPEYEEQLAWEAVERARRNPDCLRYSALELGLPLGILSMHTDEARAALGLLGLTRTGRLLYVYTARDAEGHMRVVMTKQRGERGDKFRFLCGKGSHKQVLFGADGIGDSRYVIITEGESDALAARSALWKWMGDALKNGDIDPNIAMGDAPVVVAKPDAGTFRPVWARPLRGKDVVLCVDNDQAGVDGTVKTYEILKRCGVENIYAWSALNGAKDVRDAYIRCAGSPERLVDNIFENLKRL